MKNLLFQGIYDTKTFTNLKNIGVSDFAFDLRPYSPNFTPLASIKNILDHAFSEQFFLTFSHESKGTIESFKNLLKSYPLQFKTLVRDQNEFSHLSQLDEFYWMFNPVSNWREILLLPKLKGVFLPIDFQDFYVEETDVWRIIEARNLSVYLHAKSFEQSLTLHHDKDLKLSIDLTREVESSYRNVDLGKLNKMKIWSLFS